MANTTNLVVKAVSDGVLSLDQAEAIQKDPIVGAVFGHAVNGDKASAQQTIMDAVTQGALDLDKAESLSQSINAFAELHKRSSQIDNLQDTQQTKPTLSSIVDNHIKQQVNNGINQPELSDFGYTPQKLDPAIQDPNLSDFDTLEPQSIQPEQSGIIDQNETESTQDQEAIQPFEYQPDQQQLEASRTVSESQNSATQPEQGNYPLFSGQPTDLKQSFAEKFTDAHLNNPQLKTKLINDEIASGRNRADVLKQVNEIVSAAPVQENKSEPEQANITTKGNQPTEFEASPEKQKSFSNPAKANEYIRKNNLTESHEPVLVDGLYQVKERSATQPDDQTLSINGTLEPEAIGRPSDNKPFANQQSANLALKRKNLQDTHTVVAADGGYVLQKNASESANHQTEAPVVFPVDQVKQAFSHAHLSPANTARSMKESFDRFIQSEVEKAEPLIETEQQQKAFDSAISELEKKYINEWLPPLLNAASSTVSSAVAGRNNFNSKQANRRGSALDRAMKSFDDLIQNHTGQALVKVISARTPEQRQRLLDVENEKQEQARLQELQKAEQVALAQDSTSKRRRVTNADVPDRSQAIEMTMDEWKKKHKDYKSTNLGVRMVMALNKETGGTELRPVWITDEKPSKQNIQVQTENINQLDAQANEAATSPDNNVPEPTQAQIEAGNYKKGHVKVHGLDISIENPKGSVRSGKRPDGSEWSHTMSDHYGYIKRTVGADNEHIDSYVGSNPDSDKVFIVDQLDQQTGEFDEHKVMLGFNDLDTATKAYQSNFDKDWKVGPIQSMNMNEFKDWLKNGDTKQAASSGQKPKSYEDIKSHFDDLSKRLDAADLTLKVDDIRNAYNDMLHHYDEVVAELSKNTKSVLLSQFNPFYRDRYKSENKPDIVKRLADNKFSRINFLDGGSISFVFGEKRTIPELIRDKLSTATQADLDKFLNDQKSHIEESKKEMQEAINGLKDPQTLEDFSRIYRTDGHNDFSSFYRALSTEKQALYDELKSQENNEKRLLQMEQSKAALAVNSKAIGGNADATIFSGKHTKKGHDIWTVSLNDRIGKDDFDSYRNEAKAHGGYYSSYRGGGSVPGFIFDNESAANEFLNLISGHSAESSTLESDTTVTDPNDIGEPLETDAVKHALKLKEKAQNIIDRGNESLNRDRKANTSKRAREADRAEQQANHEIFIGETMQRIAEGIEAGNIKYLSRLNAASQLRNIESLLQRASHDQQRETKSKEREINASTVAYSEYPQYKTWIDHFYDVLRDLRDIKPSLANRLDNVIDSKLSQAYKNWLLQKNEFGSENYLSVLARTSEGLPAIFKTNIQKAEKVAKAANAKAGETKFEVFKIKNGEYAVIDSHATASASGQWTPTRNDQQLNLSNSFGHEIFSALKQHQKKSPKYYINWQIESMHEQVTRMEKLGIHDPATFRAMLREYMGLRGKEKANDPVKALERSMVGRSNDGLDFFPTPRNVVEEMLDMAQLSPDMKVLEPSAGMGHIADILKENGITPDVVELSGKRQELLELKGHNVVGNDFLLYHPADKYDRIIMNPPFSDRRDAQHIYHAYDLLKDDGVLVAIAGEGVFFGSDKQAQEFQAWLEHTDAEVTQLDAGTFNDPSLPVTTGVKARIIKVSKADSANRRFSRHEPIESTNTETNIRDILTDHFGKNIIERLEQKGILTIIPTHSDKSVEGWYQDGRVTLVADQLNATTAVPTLIHELGGHGGFQSMMSDSAYSDIMSNIQALIKNGNSIALKAKERAAVEGDIAIQNDEILPYLLTVASENQANKGSTFQAVNRLVTRISSAVKSWLKNKFDLNLKLSPDEMVALAERMIKNIARSGPTTSTTEGRQFSLYEGANSPFNKAIDRVLERNTPQQYIKMGKTPDVLKMVGMPDAPITIHGRTIEKVMGEYLKIEKGDHSNLHNLTPESLRQLPQQLNNPVAVFKSSNGATRDGYVVLTELREIDTRTGANKPVVAALHVKTSKSDIEIVNIASVYGRSKSQLQRALNEDLLYWNKTKGQQILDTDGLQLPQELHADVTDLSKTNIKTNEDLVKYKEGNKPKFSRQSHANPEDLPESTQQKILNAASKSFFGQATLLGLERSKTISKQTGRLFSTMLHKALQDQDFKATFDLVQDKINHVTFSSSGSMDVAPDILTQLEKGSDYVNEAKKVGQQLAHTVKLRDKPEFQKDLEIVGDILFENTLSEEPKVFSDSELRSKNLTQQQINLYRQARAAVETSLDSFAKTTISNIYKHLGGKSDEILAITAKDLSLGEHVNEIADRMAKIVENDPDKAEAAKVAEEHIEKVVTRLEQLKDEGYMPLMRFGKYYMRVIDPTTKEVAFRQHFESEAERNLFVKNYKAPDGYKVESSQINELEHKLFQGVSPETVALFAKEAGLPVGDAEAAYIKHAVRDNHALKRLLRRQGVQGFNTDTKRVLAAFVLSNARYAANQLYNPAIDESIVEIKDPAYAEDAVRLRDYALDTQEEVAAVKNFAFVWYMGASFMFGVVNMTQPLLQTFPYLLQYSTDAGSVPRAMVRAVKSWYGKEIPTKYQDFYERARREGHLDPQNTWMLQGLERGKSGLGASTWQLISHASGFFAQASETVNRRTALFAALDIAENLGNAKLQKLGFKDAYDFAVRTIQETQGIYNKGNRPRVSRGNVGSLLMMYKQFMISYVEQMVRMQRSGLWGGEDDEFKKRMAKLVGFGISRSMLVALGVLWSFAGATGLPFMRDLLDVIETAGGMVGKPVNTEREVQIALVNALGDTLGTAATTVLLDGPANLNPVIDVKGRMGMGDLIPATAYFSPLTSEWQKSKELAGVGGAIGGLVDKAGSAIDYAQIGAYGQALGQLAPKAFTSLGQGAVAAVTGDYRNMQTGVKTNNATILDGFIKMLDAQPSGIAKEGRVRGLEMKDKAALQYVNKRAKEDYEKVLETGDQQQIIEFRKAIDDYNATEPRYPITMNLKRAETNFAKSNMNWQEKRKTTKGLDWMDDYNPYLETEQ
nr:PLxRFG domain-containing protein [Acinetobacter soli]